jgi:hypothetical protein
MAIRSVPVDQAQLGLSFISAGPKRDLEGLQRTRARMSRPSWIFGDGLGLGQAASSL